MVGPLSDRIEDLPYIFEMCLRLMAHVLLLSGEVDNRYFIISQIFESGLDQTLKKRENMSRCTFPSMGSSPRMKCMAGVGAVLLRLRIPFNVFLWKRESGDIWLVLRAKDERPDLVIGQVKVRKRCILTSGPSKHLKEKAGPNMLKREFLPFLRCSSTFFASCLFPLTICPR